MDSSIQIENIAVGHEKILEATVIGARHKKWDERPLLLVVRAEKIERYNIQFLENKIAKWWMPDDMILLKSYPIQQLEKLEK